VLLGHSSARVAERMRAQLGNALENVVLDATHTIPSDYPEDLATAVGPFMASLDAASE